MPQHIKVERIAETNVRLDGYMHHIVGRSRAEGKKGLSISWYFHGPGIPYLTEQEWGLFKESVDAVFAALKETSV